MEASKEHRSRLICVLDVETSPDPVAVALAAATGSKARSGLHALVAASALVAREQPDGSWSEIRLLTFGPPMDEFDVLMEVDDLVARLAPEEPLLVSYNGLGHDLGVIRRRAARHWLFGLPGLAALAAMDHRDLMRTMTRGWRDTWPSLRDACAGLGVSAEHIVPSAPGRTISAPARKGQVDVVATFLLLLYELAIERGSPDVLLAGWSALADRLGDASVRAPHLEQFRSHHMLNAARERRAHLR